MFASCFASLLLSFSVFYTKNYGFFWQRQETTYIYRAGRGGGSDCPIALANKKKSEVPNDICFLLALDFVGYTLAEGILGCHPNVFHTLEGAQKPHRKSYLFQKKKM